MKKKVLFALIALFSFLSSWAASGASPVQVGKYTVVLTKNCIAVGEAAPSVLTVAGSDAGFAQAEGVYEYDAEKKEFSKVSGDLEVGDYFLKVTKGDDTFYAPFQVGMSYTDNLVRVNNAESFSDGWPDENETIGGELAEGGAYYYYYQEYPWCDVWFRNGAAENGGWILYPGDVIDGDMPNTAGRFARNADGSFVSATTDQLNEWAEGILSGPDETPYVAHTWSAAKESNPDNIVFSFPAEDEPSTDTWRVVLKYGNQESMPWGNRAFGESAKNYGLISANEIAQTFGLQSFEDGAEEDLSMVLLPQMAAYVLAPSVVYNGAETEGPGFALAGNVGNMPYDVVYVTEANDDAEEMERPTSVGTYYYKIKFYKAGASSNEYTGEVVYSNSFDVTGKQVIINPSRATKVYGEPDPDPEFAIDAASLAKGDEVETAIAPFLVFKRATGNDGEAVREYNYFIDFTDEYKAGECNYDIKILQNTALLVITPATLTVKVTNNSKTVGSADPTKFEYEIVSGLVNNTIVQDTDADVTITRPSAGSVDGEKVNAHIAEDPADETKNIIVVDEGKEAYPFAGSSQNYNIEFENGFCILPKSAGLSLAVADKTYDGVAQTTYQIQENGANVTLDAADIKSVTWENNVNVSRNADGSVKEKAGKCTIVLQGDYSGTLEATFTISPATLIVTADNQVINNAAEPGDVTWTYSGWIGNEWYEDDNTTNPAKVMADGFVAPTGGTITDDTSDNFVKHIAINQDAKATNYKFEYVDGIVSIGRSILTVSVDNATKTFGEDDPEFEVSVAGLHTGDTKESVLDVGGWVYTITREGAGTEAGENVGTYALTITGPTLLKDYRVQYRNGQLTINPAEYYIVASDAEGVLGKASKTYGKDDPAFTLHVVTKKVTGEGADAVTTYTEVEGVTVPNNIRAVHLNNYWGADDAGTHDILVQERHRRNNGQWTEWAEFSNGRQYGNYIFKSERGVLAIDKLAVTIAAADNTKVFGTDDPTLVGTPLYVTTRFGNENIDYSYFTIVRDEGEDVGEYDITITAKTEKVGDKDVPTYLSANAFRNYDVTIRETPGKFTITPQGIKVIANDQVVDYGQKINPYDVKIMINEREAEWTEDQIKAVLSLSTTFTSVGAHANAYTATPAENANYAFNPETDFTNGYLTIYPLTVIPLGKDALAEMLDKKDADAAVKDALLKQVLEDHKGKKVTVILPPREMIGDQWYAWVLPFAVDPEELFDRETGWGYGALETLDVTKSTGDNVVFALQVDEIPANTPFIAKVKGHDEIKKEIQGVETTLKGITAEHMATISFANVTIGTTDYTVNPTVGTAPNVQFVGLYQDMKGPDASQLFLATTKNTNPVRDFWPGGDKSKNMTLVQTEAYLQFHDPVSAANARIFIEEEDGTLTEITGVEAGAEVAYGEGWYTVTGVKLDAEPTTTGTYIFNGKKVFIQK